MATKTKKTNRLKPLEDQVLEAGNGNENEEILLPKIEKVQISPPNMDEKTFRLIGTSPYVSNKFSAEALKEMEDRQREGSRSKTGRKRAPKNFEALYRGSMHVSTEGWIGHPASTFRQAMVDGCRLVGFKMTLAKMGVFIIEDGFDAEDGRPLVRITGEPKQFQSFVRLADGSADIASRARFEEWSIDLRIRFDLDMFSLQDISNLLARVGLQVGIGAGRPYSKTSCGQGWGTFKVG